MLLLASCGSVRFGEIFCDYCTLPRGVCHLVYHLKGTKPTFFQDCCRLVHLLLNLICATLFRQLDSHDEVCALQKAWTDTRNCPRSFSGVEIHVARAKVCFYACQRTRHWSIRALEQCTRTYQHFYIVESSFPSLYHCSEKAVQVIAVQPQHTGCEYIYICVCVSLSLCVCVCLSVCVCVCVRARVYASKDAALQWAFVYSNLLGS